MDQTKVLNNVITKVVRDQSLEVLNNYFSTTPGNSQVFNTHTVLTLLKLLKRETKHKNKSLHVDVVISCLKHFLQLKCDPSQWKSLAEDLSKLCDVVFVISSYFIKDETIIQKSVDIIIELLEQSESLADNIMRYSLKNMMDAVLLPCSGCTKLAVLSLIGVVLQKSSRQARKEVLPCTTEALGKLSNFLLASGDYETQVALVEILARCWIFVKDSESCPSLFSKKSSVMEIFNKYTFLNFDPECRLFLNEVNEGLGDDQLVYSIPCMTAYADNTRLKKPSDTMYKEFWVDFSLETKSVSFYHVPTSEEDWEFMKVLEENILVAGAWNSCCKSKSGEVIPAIKLELTLKSELEGLPSVLKIYSRKNEQFQRLEHVIKHILQNKYKTNVTYNDLPKVPSDEVKESLNQQPLTQSNKAHCPSSSYNRLQISISQSKSSSPVANENISARDSHEGSSFYNTSALNNETMVRKLSQVNNLSESDNSDVVNPSLSPSATIIDRRKGSQTTAIEDNTTSPVAGLNFSDTFTQCLIEGRKQLLNKNNDAQEIYQNNDPVQDKNNDEVKNTGNKQVKTKSQLENEESRKSELNLENEEFGIGNSKTKDLNKINVDTSVSSPLEQCHRKKLTSTAVSKPAKLDDRQEPDQKTSYNSPSPNTKSTNQRRKSSTPDGNHNRSKKRLLYSSENNTNVKDLIMSSQDDFSLEVPTYKITNQELRVESKPSIGRENISYSYINHNQKGKKVTSSKNSKELSDDNDPINETSIEEATNTFHSQRTKRQVCNSAIDDKKLRTLNKTPESTKASNIFPSHSVYSDLSSPDQKKPVKRTYARPKRQKRFKKIQVLDDSSDSEYVPPYKISSECIEPRANKKETSKPIYKRFVDLLHNEKIDPIRDKTHTDDMEIMCLENNEMENPNVTMQVRSVKVATTTISNICKKKTKQPNKAGNVKVTPKKPVNRKKKTVQCKKSELQTGQDVGGKMPEDIALESSLFFGSTNIIPQSMYLDEDEAFALDVFSCPSTQNKELSQTSFKGTEMGSFGSYLLSHVSEKLNKVQSLAHKEREMNFAAFDFKAQSACSSLHTLSDKSEAVANQLSQAISMLQTAYSIQRENAAKIRSEAGQLEEAKQELLANITKIDKTEATNVAGIFQGFGRYIRNMVVAFTRNILARKALPEPK